MDSALSAATPSKSIDFPRRNWVRPVVYLLLVVAGIVHLPYEIAYWLLASAQNLAVQEKTELALAQTERAAWWIPRSPMPPQVRSEILWRQQRAEAAESSLAQALELNPYNYRLRLNYMWLVLQRGQEDSIKQEIERLRKSPEADPGYREMFAEVLAYYGRVDEALQLLEKSPETPKEKILRALVKYSLLKSAGRYEAALAECESAIAESNQLYRLLDLFDQHITLFDERISLLLHLDRGEEALKLIHEAEAQGVGSRDKQQIAEHHNQFAYYRAVANLELEEAEKLIDLAIQAVAPLEISRLLDTRGFVYYRRGNYFKALADMDRAIELLNAESLTSSERVKQLPSLQQAKALAELNETIAVMYYHRALIHVAMNNKEAAERDLEQVRSHGRSPDRHLF